MTQVHDDDLDKVWYGGPLAPVPDLEDDPLPTGHDDLPRDWERDGFGAPAHSADQEPLFEQLRSAYLHRDDPNDGARDSDTGGWPGVSSSRSLRSAAPPAVDDLFG